MSNYNILKAYIFKKNGVIIDKHPHNFDITGIEPSTESSYYSFVDIPDNKGDNGNIGMANYDDININNLKNCYNCDSSNLPVKTLISNINNDRNLTISPSVNIKNTLLLNNSIKLNNIEGNQDNIEINYNNIRI